MVAVPIETPVTRPALLTVAMPGAPELQAPPVVASVREVVPPAQRLPAPVIVPADAADAFTVTTIICCNGYATVPIL